MLGAGRLLFRVPLVAVILVLTLSFLAVPIWANQGDSSWQMLVRWLIQGQDMSKRDRAQERRLTVNHWRLVGRGRVIQEVLQGRLSLRQAAAWFDRLDRVPADVASPFPRMRKVPNAESYCRSVVRWTERRPRYLGGPRREETIKRLHEELARALGESETMVLPEPPPLAGFPRCPEAE